MDTPDPLSAILAASPAQSKRTPCGLGKLARTLPQDQQDTLHAALIGPTSSARIADALLALHGVLLNVDMLDKHRTSGRGCSCHTIPTGWQRGRRAA